MTNPDLHPRAAWPTVGLVLALFVPGILAFGPVFAGAQGYLAAGGGVLAGVAVAYLARWRGWSLASTVAALAIAYLVLGGPLALPRTTIAGVVPTPDTLLRLVPLSVQAWRDLLTVTPPADNFIGPAVVPFLSGLVLGAIGVVLALRPRYLWALLPPLLLLVVGILWGLGDAPGALPIGLGFAVLALTFAAWRAGRDRRAAHDEILGDAVPLRRRPTGPLKAAGVLAIGTAVAVVASPLLAQGDRHVLRDVVQPPLNLADYASPLAQYRYLEVDQKEVTLFTVSGLPADARVRLATLDAYDGMVFNVADSSAGYVRIGERVATGEVAGQAARASVAVEEYTGVWLPGGGTVTGVQFEGARQQDQADSLYYNAWGGTLLTTAGVGKGDRYSVDLLVANADRKAAEQAPVANVSAPTPERVPEVVAKLATEYSSDADTPLQQLERIESKLSQTGFYSDGSDGKSRAGHTSERIAAMLNAPILIGDDEQYAVAMALMARQLGIPARVVLGFYPEGPTPETLAVKGTMAHVWVEVPFAGVGWVAFDPTPDRDRVPQTDQPKPKPQPKPQVISRPEPPLSQADDPLDDPGAAREGQDEDGWALFFRILGIVARVLGVLALLAGPFVLIGALKRARRKRRRLAPDIADRFSGGWAEIEDLATDLGTRVPPAATRRESALVLAEAYPTSGAYPLAGAVDAVVFGGGTPTEQAAESAWGSVTASLAAMRAQAGRWGRIRAFCSVRSLVGSVSWPSPRRLVAQAAGLFRRS